MERGAGLPALGAAANRTLALTARVVLRYALILAVVLVAAFAAITLPRFRATTKLERERLLAGGHVVPTVSGDIEYAERGTGPPVLVIHGAGGGHDHALFIAEHFVGIGYRFVAPSRFGYLRSPVPG